MTVYDRRHNRKGSILIVNQFFNSYDEKTGRQIVTLSPEKYIPPTVDPDRDGEFDFFIQFDINGNSLDEPITLPRPFIKDHGRVSDITNQPRYLPESVNIIDARTGDRLLTAEDIQDIMYEDELGNITIRLSELSSDLQRKIFQKKLRVRSWYIENPEEKDKWYSDSLSLERGLDQRQFNRSTMFEQLSGRLVNAAYRRTGDRDTPRDKVGVLDRITHFLGDIYLTYDERDSKFDGKDPSGLSQADRVLLRRRTSCEGAEVALSRIVRQTITTPYEGVVHVNAFQLEESVDRRIKVRAGDRHGLVMYINAQDDQDPRTFFLDATPESEKEQKRKLRAFKLLGKRGREVKQMKARTFAESEGLKPPSELHADIVEAATSLKDIWNISDDSLVDRITERLTHTEAQQFIRNQKGLEIDFLIATKKDHRQGNLGLHVYEAMVVDQVRDEYQEADTVYRLRNGWTTESPQELESLGATTLAWDIKIDAPQLLGKTSKKPIYSGWNIHDIEDILGNESNWRTQTRILESAYATANLSVQQNIDGLNQLTQSMEQMRDVGKILMQQTIEQALEGWQIGAGSIEEFMSQVPWHVLLPNPLFDCENFFRRSEENGSAGNIYPVPDQTDEYDQKMNRRMAMWYVRAQRVSSQIAKIIEDYKNGGIQQEQVVSSTYLWHKVINARPKNESTNVQKKIDPRQLFIFIAEQQYKTIYKNGIV